MRVRSVFCQCWLACSRLDRTGLNECAALAYDRKELAAMRHK
jgi:hypothetical protein